MEIGKSDVMADERQLVSNAIADTPCIKVCAIVPATGLCTGCLRSRREIASWGFLSRTERLAVQFTVLRKPR